MTFTIKTTAVSRYAAKDGQTFSREVDAQSHNAEIAVCRIYGKAYIDRVGRAFTFIRNITQHFSVIDIATLQREIRNWLDVREPQYAAIEGTIGYNINGGTEHRLIELADGSSHGSREEAASHDLMLAFNTLRPQLTSSAVIALCNGSHYTPLAEQVRYTGQFAYETGYRALLSDGEYRAIKRKSVERFSRVLDAIREARSTRIAAK